MTPEQLALVRATAPLIGEAADDFGLVFYDCLSRIRPGTQGLFPDGVKVAPRRIVDEIVFLATMAGDLPAFLARAHDLGRRQVHHGVHAHDYAAVGVALVDAVAYVVGPAWSLEAEEAWRRLYALMAEAMLEGAAGALFTAPS